MSSIHCRKRSITIYTTVSKGRASDDDRFDEICVMSSPA